MTIKWSRPDEGFVESKCGRFEIRPYFNHSASPQGYDLYLVGVQRHKIAACSTQSEAKHRAERFVRIGR